MHEKMQIRMFTSDFKLPIFIYFDRQFIYSFCVGQLLIQLEEPSVN